MTTACLFWESKINEDYQQHLTTDERAITLAALAATETVTKSSFSWPAFGDFDEDVLYVFHDRSLYETIKNIGEIDDYIAYLDGEYIER